MGPLTRRVRRTATAAGAALAVLVLMTGCGTDEIAERAAEKALEGAADGSADIDLDDDSIKIETEEGSLSVGQGLPDDFPEGEVPLPEGEVVSGMSMAGQGWTVNILVPGTVEEVSASVRSMLESAGYTIESTTEAGEMVLYSAVGESYAVTVAVADDEDVTNVSYTVVVPEE